MASIIPTEAIAQDRQNGEATASEILVLGQRTPDYAIDELTTATRTGTDILSIPQSIQVVTRQVIDDQQLVDLTGALNNVSGVLPGISAGGRSESFTIRGFRSSLYAIDSVVLSPAIETNDSYRDLANVERIEVLKGPASVLYGRGDPGGLINIVTKQPQFERATRLSLQTGSDQFVRGQADITGPVDAAHTLAYRLIGAAQTGDTFRDLFKGYSRQFLSGGLRWNPGARTRAVASLTYVHQENQTDRGIVATPDGKGGYVVDLPRERFLGEAFATTQSRRYELNYRIEHDLADWLTLRHIGHYDDGQLDLRGINYGNTVAVNARTGARTVIRAAVEQHERNHNYDFQADLIARFTTGSIGHTLAFGGERVDGYRFRTFFRSSLAAIDIDRPVYGMQPGVAVRAADRRVDATSWSAYLQDQIAIGSLIDLLAGVRMDKAITIDAGATRYRADDTAWSPRVGLVVKPLPQLSLFADYTRSFQAQALPTFSGVPIDPERGEQYEAGVKARLFDGRLLTTIAAYQLTRSHVAQSDPANVGFNIDAGVQQARGVEFDATGTIVPGVQLIATAAHTDAKVLRSTDYAAGNRLVNVPRWAASLWLTVDPAASSFGGGGGVFAASDRPGDLENSFRIGGYTRVDASLWYKVKDSLRLTVTGRNLFDRYYIDSSVSRGQIAPAAGRTLLVGLGASL